MFKTQKTVLIIDSNDIEQDATEKVINRTLNKREVKKLDKKLKGLLIEAWIYKKGMKTPEILEKYINTKTNNYFFKCVQIAQ
jgi:hypothetical protein